MSAARIARGARSLISSSSFSISRRGVSALLSDPAPLSIGPFSNLRGQVLHFSQFVEANDKWPFPAADTHALVKRMQAVEMPLNQAEVVTSVIREIVKVSYEKLAQSFPSKGEFQKDHLSSLMQREIEKLRSDTDKQHNELKSELLVEMAKFRGEIETMLSEHRAHSKKMNYELMVKVEAIKFDGLKYFVGTFVSVLGMTAGVVLTVIRTMK